MARLSLTLALCLVACTPPPERVLVGQAALATHAIHVVSHGWHTGFVVPAYDIQKRLPALRKRFGAVPFIEFGWGDAGFYQASEITLGLALQSLLWPTESVMHVVAVRRAPARVFAQSEVKRLCLSATDYAALIDFIVNSFARGANGDVVALRPGIYGGSQFYRGVGSYHAFNTCNTWTARGLERAGIDIAARFTFTASGVMRAIVADGSCAEPRTREGAITEGHCTNQPSRWCDALWLLHAVKLDSRGYTPRPDESGPTGSDAVRGCKS